jgi:cytidine diphosphoramidate kinase
MVVWFIGLSGSGKTTISSKFIKEIKKKTKKHIIHLDGDEIRFLFENRDYSVKGREKNAKVISNLSNFLNDNNVIVVASVLSIFPSWQLWNKKNIKNYFEVYVKVDFEKLLKREIKSLYKDALSGKINNVVGVDIKFPEPSPDYIFDNNKNGLDFSIKFKEIIEKMNQKGIIL